MSAKTRSKGKKQELASSSTMEDAQEIKQLITDLKCSISGEIQEFRKEFKNFRQQTETDIKTILQENKRLQENVEALEKRTTELENRMSQQEDDAWRYQTQIKELQKQVDNMSDQVDYLENKSRQNNICIYNIPEKSEGSDMMNFIQTLWRETLKMETEIPITRAHRIGQEEEERVRPIIVNCLHFNDKRAVLNAAWSKEITFAEERIYLDHDFTTKVKKQRAKYRPLRENLKSQGVKSHILAPAKLKVFNSDGTATIYRDAEQAQKDLQTKGLFNPTPGPTPGESV